MGAMGGAGGFGHNPQMAGMNPQYGAGINQPDPKSFNMAGGPNMNQPGGPGFGAGYAMG